MRRSRFGTARSGALAAAMLLVGTVSAWAQAAVVRGTVRSDGGEPVVGAGVFFTELNLQSATSDAGRFVITVPGDRVRGQTVQLRVRAIGYRPSSRPVTLVAGDQSVDFQLVQDINRLEEIVVTGVMEGTEAARVPFAVARVDVAEDVPVPSLDPIRLLAGRVPGANIMSASGRPGGSASVILRGPTSINASGRGQGPLIIVDGVILASGTPGAGGNMMGGSSSLPDINPSDIESIEVVKGAAASSLYGARAGNGVIQITTRSGRRAADGLTFNVRGEGGGSDIEGTFPLARQTSLLMDATNSRFCINRAGAPVCGNTVDWNTEVARINNEPGDFALPPSSFPLDPGAGASGLPLRNAFQAHRFPGRIYDPVAMAVEPGTFGQMSVDATGRFGQTQVFSSFGLMDQQGAIRFLEGYERYSGRLNVDQSVGDHWRLSLRSYYARSSADGFDQDGGGTAFFRLTRVPAVVNVLARDTLGRLYVRTNLQGQGSQNENPLISLSMQEDRSNTDRFLGGLTARYTPANWVDFEVNGSYDLQNYNQDLFRDKGFRTTGSNPALNGGSVRKYSSRDQSYNASLNATVRHRLGRQLQVRWNSRFLFERQDFRENQASGGTLGAVGVPDLDNTTQGTVAVSSSSSSISQVGVFAGVNLDAFDGRYILEGLVRRDGTSLFGAANRWATFGRISLVWRPSLESWWFGGSTVNDFKLRYSRGSAGGRPSFSAQYETFGVTSQGPTLQNQGNRELRPEITVDNEYGVDVELLRRVGVQVTRAVSVTRDQILQVPLPAEKGFGTQWRNAGALENKTWELAVNVPLITRRNVNWSWRATYDRTRTVITALDVPPFTFGSTLQATSNMFTARVGERYGTFYGRRFIRSCAELPTVFQADCGVDGTSSFQHNDEGYVVWVGQGNSWRDGIGRNLWQTALPGCVSQVSGAPQSCSATNTLVRAPWGVTMNWGMPIILRDSVCNTTPNASCPALQSPLGNALPDWQFSVSSNLQVGRFTIFGLLQGVMGREVWNQGRHWSHLDFITNDVDQAGKPVVTAKPIGYYWRAPAADGFTGMGGFYDQLAANSHFVEDASYAKLRELMVSYNIGPVGGMGNWTVSVLGRNLFTITNYQGFDPEVGNGGGIASSSAINAVDAFQFPNTRTLTFAVSTSF